jgi:hypothetical protein
VTGYYYLSPYPLRPVSSSILAILKAKPGKENEVEEFLKSALPLVNQEAGTIVWFAFKIRIPPIPSAIGCAKIFAHFSAVENLII